VPTPTQTATTRITVTTAASPSPRLPETSTVDAVTEQRGSSSPLILIGLTFIVAASILAAVGPRDRRTRR
jgi:hypothetical protein